MYQWLAIGWATPPPKPKSTDEGAQLAHWIHTQITVESQGHPHRSKRILTHDRHHRESMRIVHHPQVYAQCSNLHMKRDIHYSRNMAVSLFGYFGVACLSKSPCANQLVKQTHTSVVMSDLQLKHNLRLTTAEAPGVISHPAYFVYFLILPS